MKARIGVIGAGWWATAYHIPNLKRRNDVELVSVCKLEKDELELVKNKFEFKFSSTDYKEMLNFSPLDGVIISSPHFAHYENAKEALLNNCHVLIEKPMTTNSESAIELYQLAKEKNKEILIPHGHNFKDYIPSAEQFIEEGHIGEIKHIDAAFASSLTDLFAGKPLAEAEKQKDIFRPKASTWSDPEKAGGYAWGQLSHMFAGVLKITKLEADKVFCLSVPSPTKVDYTNSISIKFNNGATGSFSGCAFIPKDIRETFYINVYGNKGSLHLDLEHKRERLIVRLNNGQEIVNKIAEGEGCYSYNTKAPLDAFVDLCLGKKINNHANALIGLNTVKILDAVYRSIKSEKVEQI